MNKKGQLTVGGIIIVIMAVFVAVALGNQIINGQAQLTNTVTLNANNSGGLWTQNHTFTIPANGSTIDLLGQELIGTPSVTINVNASSVGSGNYTITEGISATTGQKSIIFCSGCNGADIDIGLPSLTANVSYEYGDYGYNEDSGSRGIASIITLMAFVGLIIFIAGYGLKQWMSR